MYARGAYMGDDLPMVFLQELWSNAVLSKEAVVSTTLLTIFVTLMLVSAHARISKITKNFFK